MSARQWIVIALMVALNGLDGFDVLSSAFASPGIAAEWHISRGALGPMLSAELVGMGFGSVLLGGAADRFGRKITMLACLVIMAVGMYLAHAASGGVPFASIPWLFDLVIWRFLTGLGIGRHAGGDQRGHGRGVEQGRPQPGDVALCDWLSAGRRDRRLRGAGMAAGRLRLARGVPVRRSGDCRDDPAGHAAGA